MSEILIIEDEPAIASALAAVGKRLGFAVRTFASGRAGLNAMHAGVALIILDIGLPDLSGLDVLKESRAHAPQVPVISITAHGNLHNAVAARQLGASAYLVKPLELADVERTIREVLAVSKATPAQPLRESAKARLLGTSPAMQRVFLEIAHATTTDAPVLLSGPTGSGKTLAARVIHEHSPRAAAPFVVLHCGALPEQLLESELFGHEKGAFTGAMTDRAGHIERARGGTLFLDEIGDISPAVQAKLLRFVEERAFTRIGGREDIRVELRLITATNKDLRAEVRAGRFRDDLFYSLHVLEIAMPPLRERPEDLPLLARNFIGTGGRSLALADETMDALMRYDWPGNLRELRNALEHAAAVCTGPVVLPVHLPRSVREEGHALPNADERLAGTMSTWLDAQLGQHIEYDAMHDRVEAMMLRHLLARFGGKPTVLARETNMNRVTLRKKLAALGIRASEADDR
jgi:DNA-binding NtrC family response regulator